MGKLIQLADNRINKGASRKAKGVLFLCFMILFSGVTGILLSQLGTAVSAVLLAILLAHRSLVDHVNQVTRSLEISLGRGREAVSKIVGRDTENMQESEVASAAIETAAENFSDGVIGPIFWFLVAGLPGLLIYKFVNTADSMIGHKTSQHQEFGWAAAKFDDLLNWAPARISCVLISITGRSLRRLLRIKQDAKLHRSPNAGWPEAAMAYSLNVAIAGPRTYGAEKQEFAWVNPNGKSATRHDIQRSTQLLWCSWVLTVIGVFVIALLR